MTNPNPFQQTMVKMMIPPGMGPNISVSGFSLQADADGCVEVPKEAAKALADHGLLQYVAPRQQAANAKEPIQKT